MQLLKEALQEQDWDKVSQVYETLSGEHIDPPDYSVNLSDVIEYLQKILAYDIDFDTTDLKVFEAPSPQKVKRGRPKGSKNKKTKIDPKMDPIVDDAEDDDDLRGLSANAKVTGKRKTQFITSDVLTKQDQADKGLYENLQKSPRRRPFKGVDMECESCLKAFTNINPVHIKVDIDTKKGKFICNECQARGKV